jgi:hypothetical protein
MRRSGIALRSLAYFGLALVATSASLASAEDLLLTMSRSLPGTLLVSEGGTWPREIYRHADGNSDLGPAVPRIASVTFGRGEGTFICSGLDGSIFKLDGSRPRLVHEHSGQVRDIAIDDGEGRIYYSVLPTPRGGESAGDCEIWYFDLRAARASRFATIEQRMVGGDFWGAFTIRGGVLYAGTLSPRGRIYRVHPGGRSELAIESGLGTITGLSFSPGGELYFATGSAKVFRTSDFQTTELVVQEPASQFTDVAVRH